MSDPMTEQNTADDTQETPVVSATPEPATTEPTVTPIAPPPAIPAVASQPQGGELRSAILSNTKLKEQALYVPEWGFTVTVREMTATTRVDVLAASDDPRTGKRDGKRLYPLITIASCFDPNTGAQIFQPTDMDELNRQGGTAMERVFQVASRLSGLNQEYLEQTKNG